MVSLNRKLLEKKYTNIRIEERIDFSQQQLTILDPQLFKGLANLKTIDLSGNEIAFIQPSTFSGLTNLKSINLSDNNIEYIAPTTFNSSTSLQVIHLYNSQITSIEPTTFTVLTNLKFIYLSFNQISTIEPNTFNGLTSLQEIYLSNNRIETLNEATFAGLNNLQTIKMHENKFKVEKLTLVLSESVKYVSFKSIDKNDIESVQTIKSVEQSLTLTTQSIEIKDAMSVQQNDNDKWPETIDPKERYKDLKKILGEGSYGFVFKAESFQQPTKLLAIKKIKIPFSFDTRKTFVSCTELSESKLLYSLTLSTSETSRFAVKCEECFFDKESYLYYVSEFCEDGNLRNKIDSNKKLGKHFDDEQINEWSKEIILGLEFLHSNGITHRNIKPANILLKDGHIKIGDLCEAKSFIDSVMDTIRVSVGYWSPEMVLFEEMPGIQITNKTDIWSAGVVIYELITLDFPFKSQPIRYSIKNAKVPELSNEKPKHFQLLINMMLHKEPTTRADSSELKAIFGYLKLVARFI